MPEGLEKSFQEHEKVGEAAFGLFHEALDVPSIQEDAEDEIDFYDALIDAQGDEIIAAWNEVRTLLEEEGYRTKEYHDRPKALTNEDPWYWPDGAGSWDIVGPDGYPWHPDGSGNPVIEAFYRAARDHYEKDVFEHVFPRSEYDPEARRERLKEVVEDA